MAATTKHIKLLGGSNEELAQANHQLRSYPHSRHAMVTIDGTGSTEKSALALAGAHRYLRDYNRLPEENASTPSFGPWPEPRY